MSLEDEADLKVLRATLLSSIRENDGNEKLTGEIYDTDVDDLEALRDAALKSLNQATDNSTMASISSKSANFPNFSPDNFWRSKCLNEGASLRNSWPHCMPRFRLRPQPRSNLIVIHTVPDAKPNSPPLPKLLLPQDRYKASVNASVKRVKNKDKWSRFNDDESSQDESDTEPSDKNTVATLKDSDSFEYNLVTVDVVHSDDGKSQKNLKNSDSSDEIVDNVRRFDNSAKLETCDACSSNDLEADEVLTSMKSPSISPRPLISDELLRPTKRRLISPRPLTSHCPMTIDHATCIAKDTVANEKPIDSHYNDIEQEFLDALPLYDVELLDCDEVNFSDHSARISMFQHTPIPSCFSNDTGPSSQNGSTSSENDADVSISSNRLSSSLVAGTGASCGEGEGLQSRRPPSIQAASRPTSTVSKPKNCLPDSRNKPPVAAHPHCESSGGGRHLHEHSHNSRRKSRDKRGRSCDKDKTSRKALCRNSSESYKKSCRRTSEKHRRKSVSTSSHRSSSSGYHQQSSSDIPHTTHKSRGHLHSLPMTDQHKHSSDKRRVHRQRRRNSGSQQKAVEKQALVVARCLVERLQVSRVNAIKRTSIGKVAGLKPLGKNHVQNSSANGALSAIATNPWLPVASSFVKTQALLATPLISTDQSANGSGTCSTASISAPPLIPAVYSLRRTLLHLPDQAALSFEKITSKPVNLTSTISDEQFSSKSVSYKRVSPALEKIAAATSERVTPARSWPKSTPKNSAAPPKKVLLVRPKILTIAKKNLTESRDRFDGALKMQSFDQCKDLRALLTENKATAAGIVTPSLERRCVRSPIIYDKSPKKKRLVYLST